MICFVIRWHFYQAADTRFSHFVYLASLDIEELHLPRVCVAPVPLSEPSHAFGSWSRSQVNCLGFYRKYCHLHLHGASASLAYWDHDKMVADLHVVFSNAVCENCVLIQLAVSRHRFRWWFRANQETSHIWTNSGKNSLSAKWSKNSWTIKKICNRRWHHHVVVRDHLRCYARGDYKPVSLCIMLKIQLKHGIAILYIYHLIWYDGVRGYKDIHKNNEIIHNYATNDHEISFFNCSDGKSHIHIHQKYYNEQNSPHGYWLPC